MLRIKLDDILIAVQNVVGYASIDSSVLGVLRYLFNERGSTFDNYVYYLSPDDNCYYGTVRGSIKGLDHSMMEVEFNGIDEDEFNALIRPCLT